MADVKTDEHGNNRFINGPKPRLILLCEVFPPEQTATARFVGGMALVLAWHFEVIVLAGKPRYSLALTELSAELSSLGVTVRRPRGSLQRSSRAFLRALQALGTTLYMLQWSLRYVRKGDFVLAVSNPPSATLAAWVASRFKSAKLIVRIDDLYPDVLVAAGVVRRDSAAERFLRWLLTVPLRGANHIIVLGEDAARLVRQRTNDETAISVTPNWYTIQPGIEDTPGSASLRQELGLKGRFVVGYLGNFGRTHDLNTIVDAAARLSPEKSSIHFLLVGDGARFSETSRRVEQLGLSNVTMLPSCSDQRLPDFLRAADVAIVSFVRGMSGVSIPSRMYNHMAAGRPIVAICEPESDLGRIAERDGAGWQIDPGDTQGLVTLLKSLASNPQTVKQFALDALRLAEERFSFGRAATDFERLASRLLLTASAEASG